MISFFLFFFTFCTIPKPKAVRSNNTDAFSRLGGYYYYQWIKTDLGGGDQADLTPEQGAKASLDIIFTEGQVYNGKMPIVYVEGFEKPRPGGWHVYDGRICEW